MNGILNTSGLDSSRALSASLISPNLYDDDHELGLESLDFDEDEDEEEDVDDEGGIVNSSLYCDSRLPEDAPDEEDDQNSKELLYDVDEILDDNNNEEDDFDEDQFEGEEEDDEAGIGIGIGLGMLQQDEEDEDPEDHPYLSTEFTNKLKQFRDQAKYDQIAETADDDNGGRRPITAKLKSQVPHFDQFNHQNSKAGKKNGGPNLLTVYSSSVEEPLSGRAGHHDKRLQDNSDELPSYVQQMMEKDESLRRLLKTGCVTISQIKPSSPNQTEPTAHCSSSTSVTCTPIQQQQRSFKGTSNTSAISPIIGSSQLFTAFTDWSQFPNVHKLMELAAFAAANVRQDELGSEEEPLAGTSKQCGSSSVLPKVKVNSTRRFLKNYARVDDEFCDVQFYEGNESPKLLGLSSNRLLEKSGKCSASALKSSSSTTPTGPSIRTNLKSSTFFSPSSLPRKYKSRPSVPRESMQSQLTRNYGKSNLAESPRAIFTGGPSGGGSDLLTKLPLPRTMAAALLDSTTKTGNRRKFTMCSSHPDQNGPSSSADELEFDPTRFLEVSLQVDEDEDDEYEHYEDAEADACSGSSTQTAKQQNSIPPPNDELRRKYKCPHCLKGFCWSTDLKRHILTHTGERPFSCSFCAANFTRKFLMQKHVKKYHGGGAGVEHAALGNSGGDVAVASNLARRTNPTNSRIHPLKKMTKVGSAPLTNGITSGSYHKNGGQVLTQSIPTTKSIKLENGLSYAGLGLLNGDNNGFIVHKNPKSDHTSSFESQHQPHHNNNGRSVTRSTPTTGFRSKVAGQRIHADSMYEDDEPEEDMDDEEDKLSGRNSCDDEIHFPSKPINPIVINISSKTNAGPPSSSSTSSRPAAPNTHLLNTADLLVEPRRINQSLVKQLIRANAQIKIAAAEAAANSSSVMTGQPVLTNGRSSGGSGSNSSDQTDSSSTTSSSITSSTIPRLKR